MKEASIRQRILVKLYWKRCWNEKHTAFENAYSGVPGHLKGAARKELLLLIKEGLVLAKQTCYGLQVSLNSNKIKEIEACLSGGI